MSETIDTVRDRYFTLSFTEFYDLIFAMDKTAWEWRNISPGLAFELQSQTSEQFTNRFHLQFIEESKQWKLWRKDAWDVDYQKVTLDKERSAKQNAQWFVKKEALKILVKSIVRLTAVTEETATTIANAVILKKNKAAAKTFGIDMDTEQWKGLLES